MDDLKTHLANLREDFTKGILSKSEVNQNPSLQFKNWLQQAIESEVPEVQAMTLSTISDKNCPSSRIVYLREFEENTFVFYGNYDSRKAKQLKENPNACLNFFWPQLERQIRIEGTISLCSDSVSDTYFNSRPTDSKIGAWASQQSSFLNSREELEQAFEKYKKTFEEKKVPRPPNWGGWQLKASYYEFWQGRKNRLHDRICYELINNDWKINRLAP